MLRQVGLGGVDFLQQLRDRFFTVAQGAQDAQAHGRGQHTKKFCREFENPNPFHLPVRCDHLVHGARRSCEYKHESYLESALPTMRRA
ncbi:hypothetical protein FQZ97_1086360 [compost metagenome]